MSEHNLPISSKYRQKPAEPVSEFEREELNRRLNDAFSAGSLDAEDYQALLDDVYAARTMGELVPVVQKLPVGATHEQPAIVAQPSHLQPGELSASRPATGLAKLAAVGTAVAVLILVVFLIASL